MLQLSSSRLVSTESQSQSRSAMVILIPKELNMSQTSFRERPPEPSESNSTNIFQIEVYFTSSWGKQRYLLFLRFQLWKRERIHFMNATLLNFDLFSILFESSIYSAYLLNYYHNIHCYQRPYFYEQGDFAPWCRQPLCQCQNQQQGSLIINLTHPQHPMHLQAHTPTLSQDTNLKLLTIRKNILHDVLRYNLQSSQDRRQVSYARHEEELVEENRMIQYEQDRLRREKEQSRLNVIRRRQMLKEEYDREIKEKEERRRRDRDADRVYAKIEKDYMEASNQRRIYDIEKMFNRKSYQASINDLSGRLKSESHNNNYDRSRLKTEPSYTNPQNSAIKRTETTNLKMKEQFPSSPMNMNGNYKDSLDRLEVPAQNSGNKNQVTPILKNGQKVSYNQNFRLDYN